jgi:uncharacterized protein (DUF169 family)
MESIIANELNLRMAPVAVYFTDTAPQEHALQFAEGARGCVVTLLRAAAEGRTAVVDRQTAGCRGGRVGLEFDDGWSDPEEMAYFLSTGGGPSKRAGEGYKKSPEMARAMFEHLEPAHEPHAYRVFRPLTAVDPAAETPELVVFLANPDQLSALVVLANYDRPTNDNVTLEFGSGCMSFCRLPHQLSQGDRPLAVLGLTDITARPYVPADVLSFSVPWQFFLEMEGNVRGSFFDRHDWQKVKARLKG